MKKIINLILIILLISNSFCIASTLKFVQMSDVHYCYRKDHTSPQTNAFKLLSLSKEIFNDAVLQVNSIKGVDFVAITGDLVDKPQMSWIQEVVSKLNTLKYPWYLTFGNHDEGLSLENKTLYLDYLKNHSKSCFLGQSYYAFTPQKGYRAIFLDSPITGEITSAGYIEPEQMEWFKTELDTHKSDTILVFMHHPLKEPFASSSHRIRNAQEVYDVLNSHNQVIAVLTGHYHAMRIQPEGHILHVSTPALVTYPFGFRLVKVTNYFNETIFDFDFYQSQVQGVKDKLRQISQNDIKWHEQYSVKRKIEG